MLSQKNVWTMALEKHTLFSYDWALKRMFSNETICTVFLPHISMKVKRYMKRIWCTGSEPLSLTRKRDGGVPSAPTKHPGTIRFLIVFIIYSEQEER